MGRRIDLSTLADQPVLDAPVPTPPTTDAITTAIGVRPVLPVLLAQVAVNPVNPRESLGDLSDLESMRTLGQLQPCLVVSRTAFLGIYAEHEPSLGSAEYVVVAGSRRRAAAEQFGLDTLTITVQDQLAASRRQFYAASVAENIDRKNFDVLEEARAVQRLTQECGSGTEAGEILGRTKGWVSQRLALLKLGTDMQRLLMVGELPIREARRLANLPVEDQLATWEAEQREAEQQRFTAVNRSSSAGEGGSDPNRSVTPGSSRARPGRISFAEDTPVIKIAEVLRGRLAPQDLEELVQALTGLPR